MACSPRPAPDASQLLSFGGWQDVECRFFDIGFKMASTLSDAGTSLLLTLAVIALAWRGIQHTLEAAEGGGSIADLIVDSVRLMFFIAIAMGILDMTGGTLGEQNYMRVLIDGFKNYERAYMSSIGRGVEDITALLLKVPTFLTDSGRNADPSMSVMDAILSGFAALNGGIVRGLVMFVLWVVVIIAAIAMMLAYLTGSVMVAVAVAVSPIFVPWIVLPATRGFFESWLRFLIGGLVTKVVGVVMLVMAVHVFGEALGSLQQAFDTAWRRGLSSGQGFGSILDYLLATSNLLIVAFMIIFLMFQVKEMAQSLLSGGLSLSTGARTAGQMAARGAVGMVKAVTNPTAILRKS